MLDHLIVMPGNVVFVTNLTKGPFQSPVKIYAKLPQLMHVIRFTAILGLVVSITKKISVVALAVAWALAVFVQ